MLITRRNMLTGFLAAPAIIAIDRLMPVKLWMPEDTTTINEIKLVDGNPETWVYVYSYDQEYHNLTLINKYRKE